jgi:hypothetical protein
MRFNKWTLGLAALVAAATSTFAQTPPTVAPTVPAGDFGVLSKGSIISFVQGVNTAHAISIAAYPGYAPDLKVSGVTKAWGFGVAALYPLGDHAFTGLRFDYLGNSFFAASADVGVKADVQLFGHTFTPFTVAGVLTPLQGAGSDNLAVGAILGAGVTTTFWKSANGKTAINGFFECEKWTIFPGVIYRPGVAVTVSF